MDKKERLRELNRGYAELRRRKQGIPVKKTFDERFYERCEPIPVTGCLLWLGNVGHSGHGRISVNGKTERVHRVSWKIKYGEIPEGMCVLHKCDIPCCINPDHLFLGTQEDNMNDMNSKNRGSCGEKSPIAKLSENDVRKIKNDSRGVTFIARDYGVAPATISSIRRGKSWKRIGGVI